MACSPFTRLFLAQIWILEFHIREKSFGNFLANFSGNLDKKLVILCCTWMKSFKRRILRHENHPDHPGTAPRRNDSPKAMYQCKDQRTSLSTALSTLALD